MTTWIARGASLALLVLAAFLGSQTDLGASTIGPKAVSVLQAAVERLDLTFSPQSHRVERSDTVQINTGGDSVAVEARTVLNVALGPGVDAPMEPGEHSLQIEEAIPITFEIDVVQDDGTVETFSIPITLDLALAVDLASAAGAASATSAAPNESIASAPVSPAAATSGNADGRLVYTVANTDSNRWELWEYDFATGETKKISNWRTEVDISRDGSQIAYFAWPGDVGNRAGIWIMDGDYSNPRPVVQGGASYPSFNPTGNRLAANSGGDIYVFNTDGSGIRRLTRGEYPDWNPVNNEIVHRACVGGACGLYVIDANSLDPNARRRLTEGGSDGQPAWSPDGTRIAYISKDDGNFEIYVINADGSGKTRLTDNPTSDGLPVWSPDGEWIAFRSDRDGSWGIFIARPDGSDMRKVLDADVLPVWFFEKMIWSN